MLTLWIPLLILLPSLAFAAPIPAVNSDLPGCADGKIMKQTGGTWTCESESAGGVAAGLITFVITGSCPAGWTEVAALNGKAIYGTIAANADVGTAVGADTITPTVNSLTAAAQTVNSLTAAAQVFTGTASTVVVNHTHTLPFARGATTGGATTTQAFTTSTDTSSTAITDVTSNPSGGAASYTPAGTNAASAVTGTMNSSAVTGTLNSFDNRSAGVKAIFCQKN